MASQLTLQLDASLAERFRNVRECIASGVYQRGLKRIAADLDIAPGNLSSALSGDGRCLSVDNMEKYIAETGDTSPVLYLVAKYIGFDEAQLAAARAVRIEALLTEANSLLREVPRTVRVRK